MFQSAFQSGELDPGVAVPPALPEVTVTAENSTYTYDPNSGNILKYTKNANGSQTWTGYTPGMMGYDGLFQLFDITFPRAVTSVLLQQSTASPGGTGTAQAGGNGAKPPGGGPRPTAGGDFCSFTPDTQVSTDHGTQSIRTLHVGEKVQAYNPKTHKMEVQPIMHVWIHPDNDLVDLTITTAAKAPHGSTPNAQREVVHTNQKHPFLTTEHGFVPVKQITVGMHVVRADGSIGLITRWTSVPGVKMMYNLEVAQDHTFTVGDGQWIVHNCGINREVDLGAVNSYEQARNKAMDTLGDLGPDSKPYIGHLGVGEDLITGRSSGDDLARWRLDYDPTKGPHINVDDFRYSKSGGLKGYIQFPGDESTVISLLRHLNR